MRIVVAGATWHIGGYLIRGLVTDGGRRPCPRTKSHGRGPAYGPVGQRGSSSVTRRQVSARVERRPSLRSMHGADDSGAGAVGMAIPRS